MENKSFVFAHIIIHFPLYLSAGRRKVQVVLGCLVDQFSLMPTANWKVSKTFFSALYALLLKIFLKLSFAARSVTRLASQWGEFQSQNEKVCSVFFFPLLLQRRTWIYINEEWIKIIPEMKMYSVCKLKWSASARNHCFLQWQNLLYDKIVIIKFDRL